MKRIIKGVFLAVTCMAFSLTAFAVSEIGTQNGTFSDVDNNAWYAKEVDTAYELGFLEGTGDNLFSPDSTVTVAQGITLASRLNALYNGDDIEDSADGEWYDSYVEYALENELVDELQFDSYTRQLKRYEMAELLYDALPEDYYPPINDIVFVPDIPIGSIYWDKVLTLYKAGILTGCDEYGTFNPDSALKRSEFAAIVNRAAVKEKRVKTVLADFASDNAYTLCYNTTLNGYKEGINSGWILDNRGGAPKYTNSDFGTVMDISEEYRTVYVREFNYIPKGNIVLETKLSSFADGAFLEYCDIEGNSTYMIKVVDGYWSVLGADGEYEPVLVNDTDDYNFRISVNLDTGKSTTIINGTACGTHDLLSDNVIKLNVGIDEKGTGIMNLSVFNIVVNYNVYENFDIFGTDSVYGWTTSGSVVNTSSQLEMAGGSSATKRFEQANGNVCFETYFNTTQGSDFSFKLGDALTVQSLDSKLQAGGDEFYTLTTNMWYRLRVEADTDKGVAKIYLNGMLKGETDLDETDGISSLRIEADGELLIDNLKIYKLYEYDDYCPEPEVRASMDDYIVGLNICSLWRNGTHFGWHCISPYDEPKPVLGYYDEGVPETADWEIKYMVEHGIDFQAFCWYCDTSSGPLKEPRNGEQLHNAYQYAKYSDYMKYCILIEAKSNGFNSEQFRNHVVPYWFENYFLDERYMTIDNQLVLPIYAASSFASSKYFGTAEETKAELDYLEEVAKSYGFDGVLFFACGSSNDLLSSMGFDAAFAYNWGTAGSSLEVNKDKILSSAENTTMYTIPTISSGFDSIPWHGERYDLMSVEDYASAADWVKNTYLPEYSGNYEWADRLTWLSTWNEYGEGTYIMPAGLNGFGYLDVLREAYTDLPQEHTDVVPTLKQKERITHLYPQYATLLRCEGWYDFNLTEEQQQAEPDNQLYINGRNVFAESAHEIPPVVKDGTVYFPFEPVTCANYILNVHHEWRKDAGTLLIEGGGHSLKFLVGSNRYVKDGVEQDLGYVLETLDGIPMLDFKKLSDDLGYTYEEKDGDLYIYADNYGEVWENVSNRTLGTFEFNDYDNEGWSSGDMLLYVTDGALKTETIVKTNDPIMRYCSNSFPLDFYTKKYTAIELRVRYKYDAAYRHNITFYYITDSDNTWNETKTCRARLGSTDTNGEWETITIDLTQDQNWLTSERLTGLRLDPFSTTGEMEFDYIRFIEDPDFVYIPIEERPIEIINGDAEGTLLSFYSANATITREKDPEDENNYVWHLVPIAGKQWTYLRHNVYYKNNYKYKVEFDVKLDENNGGDETVTKTHVAANLRYTDSKLSGSYDHVVRTHTLSLDDGWVHYSYEATVSDLVDNMNSEFTVYMNPIGNLAFGYYIDNIVVTELGPVETSETAEE